MPKDFKEKYPSTRVIVDGTECVITKPKKPRAQQVTFSTYKNKNTTKVLVDATPEDLCCMVTDACGGSATDRQIVERCGLRDKCEPGDSIMADKGFNVQDIIGTKDMTVNIPERFSKKNRLSSHTVPKTGKFQVKGCTENVLYG